MPGVDVTYHDKLLLLLNNQLDKSLMIYLSSKERPLDDVYTVPVDNMFQLPDLVYIMLLLLNVVVYDDCHNAVVPSSALFLLLNSLTDTLQNVACFLQSFPKHRLKHCILTCKTLSLDTLHMHP